MAIRTTAVLGLLMLNTGAYAQISTVDGPVTATEDSTIYAAADVPGAEHSVKLSHYGYVEEEYFIGGEATAYRHGASGLEPLHSNLPYTTRIILRRPAEPADFSGVVHFEPIHPTHGTTALWLVLKQYLMARGDIYVAAAIGDASKGWSGSPYVSDPDAPIGQARLAKWIAPERYGRLSWPEEEGIRYEVMADIGRKLRSDDPNNPLRNLSVKAMLVGGWSYTGSVQRTFINEGFHDSARLADGSPVFDGYLIGVSSSLNNPGYLPLHNEEPFVPLGDERRELRKTDARVIEFLTESEVEMAIGEELPDSDEKIGGHRLYELAGVVHMSSLVGSEYSRRGWPIMAQLLQHGYPEVKVAGETISCSLPQSDLPHGALVRGAVENLRQWVLDGTPPPHAEQLKWDGDKLARDDVGNVLGGVRPAEFEAPLARYGRYKGNDIPDCRADSLYPDVFFVKDELPREELLQRYGNVANYLDLHDREIDRLYGERWLLLEDALRLKAKAREVAHRLF